MKLTIETEQEEDGRWIAESLEIPGALAYGETKQQAIANVEALALRVIADRLEHGESALIVPEISFVT
ncbi:MAG: type II toxin-antitoxin system HicB family antitoxin, partial [Chloroflexota bacterium]